MREEKNATLPRRMEILQKRIERWRRTRKRVSPMPEGIWTAATDLAKEHGVFRIARAARIDFGALKRRVASSGGTSEACKSQAGFIELQPFAAPPRGEAILDFVDDTGAKMTCRLIGKIEIDLIELANAFWNRRAWNSRA